MLYNVQKLLIVE